MRSKTLLRLLGAAGVLAGAAGCGDYRALNEANPAFRRADAARQAGQYATAIAGYQECLRLAPGSYRAHLQLALLFANQQPDLPQAIAHYQAYLATPAADQRDEVGRLLRLAKTKYFEELQRELAPPVSTLPLPRSRAELQTLPAPRVATVPLTDHSAATEPPPAATEPPPAATAATSEPPSPAARTYVAAPGDTLSKISRQFYGTAKHWERIYDANRGVLPAADKLEAGQTLVIPPAP